MIKNVVTEFCSAEQFLLCLLIFPLSLSLSVSPSLCLSFSLCLSISLSLSLSVSQSLCPSFSLALSPPPFLSLSFPPPTPMHTHPKERPCGRHSGKAAISTQKESPHQKLSRPAWWFGLQPPELWENKFLLFKPWVYGTLLWQLRLTNTTFMYQKI